MSPAPFQSLIDAIDEYSSWVSTLNANPNPESAEETCLAGRTAYHLLEMAGWRGFLAEHPKEFQQLYDITVIADSAMNRIVGHSAHSMHAQRSTSCRLRAIAALLIRQDEAAADEAMESLLAIPSSFDSEQSLDDSGVAR
ncbi:MAG: hypothetical protein H8E37_13745 [Planctomycetes bacterium]|nr:hypothetical protein [Planctomycetota bacterium]